jgi:hypothetical protein
MLNTYIKKYTEEIFNYINNIERPTKKVLFKESSIKDLLIQIENINYNFINQELRNDIIMIINNFFPKLNFDDKTILVKLTIFIVEIISTKYNFKKEKCYYEQWTQNNYRDLKSTLLLLLPFIDDNPEKQLFNKITDLNQLIYAIKDAKYIPNNLVDIERNKDTLDKYFKYGNIGLSLINTNSNKDSHLLDLFINNEKLIYKLINHNLIGLLKTLEMMNGKYYINWINISPFNLDNYINSDIKIADPTFSLTNVSIGNGYFSWGHEIDRNHVGNLLQLQSINAFIDPSTNLENYPLDSTFLTNRRLHAIGAGNCDFLAINTNNPALNLPNPKRGCAYPMNWGQTLSFFIYNPYTGPKFSSCSFLPRAVED